MRDQSLQVLRAIASLLVVFVHSINYLIVRGVSFPDELIKYKFIGDVGVDIFFVLSGYVMMLAIERYCDPKIFLIRRLIRIWPLYIFYSLLLFLSYLLVNPEALDFFNVIKSIFFIPSHIDNYHFLPFLGPGWTLGYEFIFYIVIFLSLFFKSKWMIPVFILFIVLLGTIFNTGYSQYYLNSILIEFLYGVLIFKMLSKYDVNIWMIIAVGGAAVYSFAIIEFQLDPARFYKYGFLAVFIFLLVKYITLNNKLLLLIGDASYTLYLMHMALGFQVYWKIFGGMNLSVWHLLFLIVFLVVLSLILYEVVEKKMMVLFQGKLRQFYG